MGALAEVLMWLVVILMLAGVLFELVALRHIVADLAEAVAADGGGAGGHRRE